MHDASTTKKGQTEHDCRVRLTRQFVYRKRTSIRQMQFLRWLAYRFNSHPCFKRQPKYRIRMSVDRIQCLRTKGRRSPFHLDRARGLQANGPLPPPARYTNSLPYKSVSPAHQKPLQITKTPRALRAPNPRHDQYREVSTRTKLHDSIK